MNSDPTPNDGESVLSDAATRQMTRAFVGEASHYLAQIKRQALRQALENEELHRWRTYLPDVIYELEEAVRTLDDLSAPDASEDAPH